MILGDKNIDRIADRTADEEAIRVRIATLMVDYMAVDCAQVLGGEPLAELLDSLALLELLMLVEREWDVTLDFDEAIRTPDLDAASLAARVTAALDSRSPYPLAMPRPAPDARRAERLSPQRAELLSPQRAELLSPQRAELPVAQAGLPA